jgi:hypothetical protein
MSGSIIAFAFFFFDFVIDGISFPMPAFLSGEACGTAGEFCLLFSLGVSVGVGIGVGVDGERRSVKGFIAVAISVMAADDDDDDDDVSSAFRSLPPLREGDLKTEVLAASC